MSEKKPAKPPRKPAAKTRARPLGRPSKYTKKVSEQICARLADGEPLRQICRDPKMPAWRTVYDWKAAHPDFAARIALAREAGHDAIAQQCLDIADDTDKDTLSTEHGDRPNTEWISRSKLRIETRLRLLAKWDPTRYGEKLTQELTGKDGGPIQHRVTQMTDEELDAELARAAATVGANSRT